MFEPTPSPQVEDHGRRDDGYHPIACGSDGKADASPFEFEHHSGGGGKAVGTSSGEADRVHMFDEVLGSQQVCLVCAGSATPDIDSCRCPVRHQDDRGARSPTPADPS